MNQKDMLALVAAVALCGILVRLLCYNPAFGLTVNTTSKELFGG